MWSVFDRYLVNLAWSISITTPLAAMCINVLARQQFMNFKHYTGVAAEIDRSWSREMKLYLTGESTMGDFVPPPQILLEKSIVKKHRY